MIELNEKEQKTLTRLMAQGLSKGEALIKMGKATRKVEDIKEVPKAKKERPVDPIKDWFMGCVGVVLNGMVNNAEMPHEVSCVLRDGTKKFDITINGESYTLALTKHKK